MTTLAISGLCLRRKEGFQLGPLDLEIPSGARMALVGPSGCGKTTLLRCLAGLEDVDRGLVRFADRTVTDGRHLVPAERRGIGFVFQDGGLWPHMTAREHLCFSAPELDAQGIDALLERVGLGQARDARPGRLSGGEGRRLALARALVGNPEILLLDEPLHSVDGHRRDDLALLIRGLSEERGLTTVLVTHDRAEALAVADRIAVLRDGLLVEEGPAVELVRAPRTPFTARFLGRATCFPAADRDNGTVSSALGTFPKPADAVGPWTVAVLPGDLVVGSGGSALEGRVLRTVPRPGGWLATVELGGLPVHISCADDPALGSVLSLVFAHPPRVLAGSVEEGE